jgi:hypothetical protein
VRCKCVHNALYLISQIYSSMHSRNQSHSAIIFSAYLKFATCYICNALVVSLFLQIPNLILYQTYQDTELVLIQMRLNTSDGGSNKISEDISKITKNEQWHDAKMIWRRYGRNHNRHQINFKAFRC